MIAVVGHGGSVTPAPVPKPARAPTDELRRILLAEIHESPLNPRTRYDQRALEELADSMLSSGQLTPVLVRPRRGKGVQGSGYELAAGHRRYRAAKLAREKSPDGAGYRGLDSLTAIVREMDDRIFVEVLNIENLQRDDLHPLEEAQGFRDLMEKAGYDVAKIAARVGRSTKYVYDRIKLLQLVPEAKKLFLDGGFEAGHAIILARLSPADQRRAIDKDNEGRWGKPGGLYIAEYADAHPDLPAQEQLRLEESVKPVSVREFQTWVDDNVRMKPEDVDGFLFPDTAKLLGQATEEEIKVVHITHDYRVPDAARDEKQRTYGENYWKRADGKLKSKTCDYSVAGIVVAGPGRGEAFPVCVRKDKCKTHWAKEQRQLAEDRKARERAARTSHGSSSINDDWWAREEAKRKKHEAERARWKQAAPKIREAVVARIKAMPIAGITRIVLSEYAGITQAKQALGGREGPEDLLRRLAFVAVVQVLGEWNVATAAPRALKPIGVDAVKIVDEVAPRPKAEAKRANKKGGR